MADESFSAVLAMGKWTWVSAILLQLLLYILRLNAADPALDSFLSSVNEVVGHRFPLPNEIVDRNVADMPQNPAYTSPFHEVYSAKSNDGGVQRVHYAVDDNGLRANFHSNLANVPPSNTPSLQPWSVQNSVNVPVLSQLPYRPDESPNSSFQRAENVNSHFLAASDWISSPKAREDSVYTESKSGRSPGYPFTANQLGENYGLGQTFGTFGQRIRKSEADPTANSGMDQFKPSGRDYSIFPQYQSASYADVRPPYLPVNPLDEFVRLPKAIYPSVNSDASAQVKAQPIEAFVNEFETERSGNNNYQEQESDLNTEESPALEKEPRIWMPQAENAEVFTPKIKYIESKTLRFQSDKLKTPTKKANEKQKKAGFVSENPDKTASKVFDITSDDGRFYYYVMNNAEPMQNLPKLTSPIYSTGNALLTLLNETGVDYKNEFLPTKISNRADDASKVPLEIQGTQKNVNITEATAAPVSRKDIEMNLRDIIQHLEKKIQAEQVTEKSLKHLENKTENSKVKQIEVVPTTQSDITTLFPTGEEYVTNVLKSTNTVPGHISNKVDEMPALDNITDSNVLFITIPKLASDLEAAADIISSTPPSLDETAETQATSIGFTSEGTVSSKESTTTYTSPEETTEQPMTETMKTTLLTTQTSKPTTNVIFSTYVYDKAAAVHADGITATPSTSQPTYINQDNTGVYATTAIPFEAPETPVNTSFIDGNIDTISSKEKAINLPFVDDAKELITGTRKNLSSIADGKESKTDPKDLNKSESDFSRGNAPMMVIQVKDMEDLKNQILGMVKHSLEKADETRDKAKTYKPNDNDSNKISELKNLLQADEPVRNSESVSVKNISTEVSKQYAKVIPQNERASSAPFQMNEQPKLEIPLQLNDFDNRFSRSQNEPQLIFGIPIAIALADSRISSFQQSGDDARFSSVMHNLESREHDHLDGSVAEYSLLPPEATNSVGGNGYLPQVIYDSNLVNAYPGQTSDILLVVNENFQENGTSSFDQGVQAFYVENGDFREYVDYGGQHRGHDDGMSMQAASQIAEQVIVPPVPFTLTSVNPSHEPSGISPAAPQPNEIQPAPNVESADFESIKLRRSRPLSRLDSYQLSNTDPAPEMYNSLSGDDIEIIDIIDLGPNVAIARNQDNSDIVREDFETLQDGTHVNEQNILYNDILRNILLQDVSPHQQQGTGYGSYSLKRSNDQLDNQGNEFTSRKQLLMENSISSDRTINEIFDPEQERLYGAEAYEIGDDKLEVSNDRYGLVNRNMDRIPIKLQETVAGYGRRT